MPPPFCIVFTASEKQPVRKSIRRSLNTTTNNVLGTKTVFTHHTPSAPRVLYHASDVVPPKGRELKSPFMLIRALGTSWV